MLIISKQYKTSLYMITDKKIDLPCVMIYEAIRAATARAIVALIFIHWKFSKMFLLIRNCMV